MTTDSRTATPASPLLEEHRALGAKFTEFAGWRMPLSYGGDVAEHHAVRRSAGLFDLSHMGELHVRGREAGPALDYALAGKLSAVANGRAKYSLMCSHDGGVLDDVVVYRIAADDFMIVANASNVATVYTQLLARTTLFDVDVTDASADTSLIALQGPRAIDIITPLVDDDSRTRLPALKYYASMPVRLADAAVTLARTGYTGEDGFELYVANSSAVDVWRALLKATTAAGGAAAGLAARDSLRLEAGMALYGHELSVEVNPFEAGLGRVVALDKTFIGSAALQRMSENQPHRRLVGLVGAGRRAARAGYTILAEQQSVGVVTSGVLSPTLGHPIALGYVSTTHSVPGTTLTVDIRGTSAEFTVTTAPFYKRSPS